MTKLKPLPRKPKTLSDAEIHAALVRVSNAIDRGEISLEDRRFLVQHLKSKRAREAAPLVMRLPDEHFFMVMDRIDHRPWLVPALADPLLSRAIDLDCAGSSLVNSYLLPLASRDNAALMARVLDLYIAFVEDDPEHWRWWHATSNVFELILRLRNPEIADTLACWIRANPRLLHKVPFKMGNRFLARHPRATLAILSAVDGHLEAELQGRLAGAHRGQPHWEPLFRSDRHSELRRISLARKLPLETIIALPMRQLRPYLPGYSTAGAAPDADPKADKETSHEI